MTVDGGDNTADSNITKRALAASLKQLMEHTPIEKISVFDICDACEMNRKSFYYHFRDKYDLVNWICDVEFFRAAGLDGVGDPWEYLRELCGYLYENRSFYSRAFKIKGQKSFYEHFREMLTPIVSALISHGGTDNISAFCLDFYLDAFCGAFERWMRVKDCIAPESFCDNLVGCFNLR